MIPFVQGALWPLETGGSTSVYDDVGFPDASEKTSPSLFLLIITKGLRAEMGQGPSPPFLQKYHGRGFYDFPKIPQPGSSRME